MHLSDFNDAAKTLKASRDVGAQLFCALLRSVDVEARLVCSLQVLPFQPAPKVTLSQARRRNPQALNPASRQTTPPRDSEPDTNSDGPGFTVRRRGPPGRYSRSGPETSTNAEEARSGTLSVDVPVRSRSELNLSKFI